MKPFSSREFRERLMAALSLRSRLAKSYTNPTQWLNSDDAVTLAEQANDTLSEAVKPYPDRFRTFATLPWNNPTAAADELRRTVNELGFVGTLRTF